MKEKLNKYIGHLVRIILTLCVIGYIVVNNTDLNIENYKFLSILKSPWLALVVGAIYAYLEKDKLWIIKDVFVGKETYVENDELIKKIIQYKMENTRSIREQIIDVIKSIVVAAIIVVMVVFMKKLIFNYFKIDTTRIEVHMQYIVLGVALVGVVAILNLAYRGFKKVIEWTFRR